MNNNTSLDDIAKAIFIVNRHAKAALEPEHLYALKKAAITKLIREKKAIKVGLHFSKKPKLSHQHSTLLIKVGHYYFHLPPSKDDFKQLEHLGSLDENFRNPPTKMALSRAKRIIYDYTDWKEPVKRAKRRTYSTYYTPSSLGKMEWPPTKKFRH